MPPPTCATLVGAAASQWGLDAGPATEGGAVLAPARGLRRSCRRPRPARGGATGHAAEVVGPLPGHRPEHAARRHSRQADRRRRPMCRTCGYPACCTPAWCAAPATARPEGRGLRRRGAWRASSPSSRRPLRRGDRRAGVDRGPGPQGAASRRLAPRRRRCRRRHPRRCVTCPRRRRDLRSHGGRAIGGARISARLHPFLLPRIDRAFLRGGALGGRRPHRLDPQPGRRAAAQGARRAGAPAAGEGALQVPTSGRGPAATDTTARTTSPLMLRSPRAPCPAGRCACNGCASRSTAGSRWVRPMTVDLHGRAPRPTPGSPSWRYRGLVQRAQRGVRAGAGGACSPASEVEPPFTAPGSRSRSRCREGGAGPQFGADRSTAIPAAQRGVYHFTTEDSVPRLGAALTGGALPTSSRWKASWTSWRSPHGADPIAFRLAPPGPTSAAAPSSQRRGEALAGRAKEAERSAGLLPSRATRTSRDLCAMADGSPRRARQRPHPHPARRWRRSTCGEAVNPDGIRAIRSRGAIVQSALLVPRARKR